MTGKERLKKAWGCWLKTATAFIVTAVLLLVMMICSMLVGGFSVSLGDIFRGLFVEYNRDVAIVIELRFPRIFVSVLGGAAMAAAGILLQAVMRNPLADPGIIGISSSSAFFAVIITALFPVISFLAPVFSFIGGMVAFVIVYALSIKYQKCLSRGAAKYFSAENRLPSSSEKSTPKKYRSFISTIQYLTI